MYTDFFILVQFITFSLFSLASCYVSDDQNLSIKAVHTHKRFIASLILLLFCMYGMAIVIILKI